MLDEDSGSAASSTQTPTSESESGGARRAVSRPAGPPAAAPFSAAEPAEKPAKKATRRPRKAAASETDAAPADEPSAEPADKPAKKPAKKAAKKTTKKATEPAGAPANDVEPSDETQPASPFAVPLFQAPDPVLAKPKKQPAPVDTSDEDDRPDGNDETDGSDDDDSSGGRRRRRRGGRRRRRSGEDDGDPAADESSDGDSSDGDSKKQDRPKSDGKADSKDSGSKDGAQSGKDASADRDDSEKDSSGDDKQDESKSSRRRRRRRRRGEDSGGATDDPENTVTKVRERRSAEDEITSVSGSTRLEAKKQRRREGREAGRRRAPIVTEAEFLARRESVKREMVIRQKADLAQIAVLEDDVLVEHYVARESQTSMIGNVYLGRVQNVLPSMEAAFIDIGKGRNGVLYAGEVDWKALGDGKPRKIEEALKSGQMVLVQVTKDPVGHKGARLTSQISLAGRFLVYVPGGQTNGISRKLPDTERSRLKGLLKEVLPEEAGVIIRTAAEGATEEQLNRDVSALTARWDDITRKSEGGNAPQLLYGEPDLMIKVVRDLFNEDFAKLSVEGDTAWDMIEGYVQHVAPDLADRLEHWSGDDGTDVFTTYRIDEQIAKAVDRKVWLPSGGSLIIDRTEAMTVVDVNTGKFTGSGGNLEETVTKNNLEAAEEIVRQLRLRDIGGIIVIDFIDMVMESNRDLVLRRLVECLGRDRTRHQVAEVTSLGLVQMTRKRIGTGLVEAFSETCEHCHGRGLIVHSEPIERKAQSDDSGRGRRRGRGRPGDKQKDSGDKQKDSGKQEQRKEQDGKSGEAKQGDAKQDDAKQDDAKQGDTKQSDAKQDDAKQSDAKQSDAKQGDAKQGDATDAPAQTAPEQPRSRRRGRASRAQGAPAHAAPEHAAPEQGASDRSDPDGGAQPTTAAGGDERDCEREQARESVAADVAAEGN